MSQQQLNRIEEKLDKVIEVAGQRNVEIENRITKVEKDVSLGKWIGSTAVVTLLGLIGYKAN